MRTPSISSSEEEWPNQVTRKPECGLTAYARGSVRNGPGDFLGERAADPKKKRGPTLNMSESPPTLVGTGLM